LAYVRQRGGVTNGAFYYHFDSKDALAVAVIDQFQITIRDAFRGKRGPDKHRREADVVFRFSRDQLR
jgi:AcrR family transcriptional regulator